MLSAVGFDDQSMAQADEVGDVGPYGLLALELEAEESTRPQVIPKALLGIGLLRPEGFCSLERDALPRLWRGPLPNPSPACGRGALM